MMKRLPLLFMILILIACLHAAQPEAIFNFNAYYEGREQTSKWLELEIFDGTSSMKNAAIITLADPQISTEQSAGNTSDSPVFTWKLTGNVDKKVTITFTFLPLQALYNNTYYIPAHTFKMTMNDTTFDNAQHGDDIVNHIYDGMYKSNSTAKTQSFSTMQQGNYPYPGYVNSSTKKPQTMVFTYAGSILRKDGGNGVKDKIPVAPTPGSGLPDYTGTIWTRSGSCILVINNYNTSEGVFDYVSNVEIAVKVE